MNAEIRKMTNFGVPGDWTPPVFVKHAEEKV